MRLALSLFCALGLAASAAAQSFECQPLGPFQFVGTAADCENVTSNNLGAGTGISATPICGMPSSGNQYGFLRASGQALGLAPGGLLPRPIDQTSLSEVLLAVPPGATSLTIHWNFMSAELNGESFFRDGFDMTIVDGLGNPLFHVAGGDTTTVSYAPSACTSGALTDTGVDGTEVTVVVALPALPNVCDLSIVCFNGGDTLQSSAMAIDCVLWGEFELGNLAGPRIIDLAPLTSFKLGATTTIQVQAGVPFLEGHDCLVGQVYDGNIPIAVPAYAGFLYIGMDRPFLVLQETLLGGSTFGAGKGPAQSFFFPLLPDFCGAGIIVQGYVVNEFGLNPTFTTALLGFLH